MALVSLCSGKVRSSLGTSRQLTFGLDLHQLLTGSDVMEREGEAIRVVGEKTFFFLIFILSVFHPTLSQLHSEWYGFYIGILLLKKIDHCYICSSKQR